jgi:nucleoside-diphosphate-sugar epimerase
MRVLVTGSSGFLGAAIARELLARGDTVIGFDAHAGPAGCSDGRLVQVTGDIADAKQVTRALATHAPDAVIHCAAIVSVLSSVDTPIRIVRVNIEGSLNVFEAMRRAGVRRCIHISSEEAYGSFRADKIDETHPLDPVMPYGICKAAVEHFGRTYRDLHGLEVINLRPSWVYGPGLPRDRVPKNLIDAALAGRKLHIPSGADSAIDHTYVDDAVAAIVAALDHVGHHYDAYNVGSGAAVSVAGMIAIIRELVPGAELSVGPGPYRHGDRIEIVGKGALDVSRAAAEFGWRPRFDIRSGLAAYVKALRDLQTASNTH